MKILWTENKHINQEAVLFLKKKGHEVEQAQHTRQSLVPVIDQHEALIVRLGIKFDEDLISRAPRLKLLATLTTGTDHIDRNYLRRKGIALLSLQGERAFLDGVTATAELTWGLIMALTRNIVAAADSVAAGAWRRDLFWGRDLSGKVLGIVGLGRLGEQVANYADAFGMRVVYFDPAVINEKHQAMSSLEHLASEADVITIHVPLSDLTYKLITRDFFAAMRPGALLVNTSRGGVIDELALLRALQTGRLGGAALDVLEGEAGVNGMSGPLIDYAGERDNLIITPHIGGASIDALNRVEMFMAQKVARWAELESRF